MAGLLCAGDLYLGLYDTNGAFLGYLPTPINAQQLEFTPGEVTRVERISKLRDSYGQALSSVARPSPHTVTVQYDSQSAETLRLAFLGDLSAINEAAGAFTDEPVTAALDRWQPIGVRNIDESTFALTTTDGATEFVKDTDYVLHARAGMIRALPGGAITDGQELHADGSTLLVTGNRVVAATQQSLKARLFLDGINLDGRRPIVVEAFEADLAPDGGVDLMSEEFVTTTLTGTLVTPAGKTGPYEIHSDLML